MSSSSSDNEIYQIKPVEIVYDEERIKILIDDTRKRILSIMTDDEKDFNVTEIADRMGTNPQRIYHHVDKLVEYKFLFKTREERKKRAITTYYARTAKAFIVSYSTDRGYIHDQGLIDHFLTTFRQILGVNLSQREELELGRNIKRLSDLSSSIFTEYSNRDDEAIERHTIENLYFLLEFLMFYSNPDGRELIENIKDLILPKLSIDEGNGFKTIKY